MIKGLEELCRLNGTSGGESRVREYIRSHISADEVFTDALGNLIVFKKGRKTPKNRIMFAAHMDEVGFLVRDITEDGMLKLAKAGGIDPRVLIGRRMRVGEQKLPGIISLKAIHLTTPEERKEAPGLDSLYIDIGCTSREEAEALVMRGEPAVFDSRFMEFGVDCVKAKAIDDRIGCAVMLELLKNDLSETDTREYTKTLTLDSKTKDVNAIIKTLDPELSVTTEDGYSGVLKPDESSISVAASGYKTSQISNYSASNCDYTAVSPVALFKHGILNLRLSLSGLALFPCRNHK